MAFVGICHGESIRFTPGKPCHEELKKKNSFDSFLGTEKERDSSTSLQCGGDDSVPFVWGFLFNILSVTKG